MTTFRTSRADSPFRKARHIENRYARTLRGIARAIGRLVDGFDSPVDAPGAEDEIESALTRYGSILADWAPAVAARIIAEVDRQDVASWRAHARQMGHALRREIFGAPTGAVLRESLDRQVGLITSLPTEAAARVHKLTIEAMLQGTRAKAIAAEIGRTGEVTAARATLIARTEISRTASELTQARAVHVGSSQYYWRTAGDSDVRPDHQILNGKVFSWGDPPVADRRSGARAIPGGIYNCRCWADPIVPDD